MYISGYAAPLESSKEHLKWGDGIEVDQTPPFLILKRKTKRRKLWGLFFSRGNFSWELFSFKIKIKFTLEFD